MVKIGHIEFTQAPLILAPLEDVTDSPFRRICKKYAADLVFTEFISSEGLIRDARKSVHKLKFHEAERPIAIQIFGHDVQSMIRAAEMAEEAKPDIIDLNFGCPVRKVVNKGGGAALLKDTDLMVEMTRAVINAVKVPVTVKTRLGWDQQDKPIVELSRRLQDVGIQALSVHGRTAVQLYQGLADWTLFAEIKNQQDFNIPLIGNGDVKCPEDAKRMLDDYGVDGVMIGRAAIGYPWIFQQCRDFLNTGKYLSEISIIERVEVCKIHLRNAVEWKSEKKAIFEMRKHYSHYFKGLHGFKPIRMKLMQALLEEEVKGILLEIKA